MSKEAKDRILSLGSIVITANAANVLHEDDAREALKRHALCDWGDCDPEDVEGKEFALDNDLRIISVYHDRHGTAFWIITEADRSATTLILPEDY